MKKLSGLIGVPTESTEFGPRLRLQTNVLQWVPRKYKVLHQSNVNDPFHPRNGTWKRRKISLEVLSNSIDMDDEQDNFTARGVDSVSESFAATMSEFHNESTTTFQMTELLYGTMRVMNNKVQTQSLFSSTNEQQPKGSTSFTKLTFDLEQIENALTFDIPDKRAVPFPFEDDENSHAQEDDDHQSLSPSAPSPNNDAEEDERRSQGSMLLDSPSDSELLDEAERQTLQRSSSAPHRQQSSINRSTIGQLSPSTPLSPNNSSSPRATTPHASSNKRKTVDRVVYTCGNIGLRITFVDESRSPVILAFRQSNETHMWTGVLRFVLTRHLKWTTFADTCFGLQHADLAVVPDKPNDENLVNFMLAVGDREHVARDERLPPCSGILTLCDRNAGRDPLHPRLRRWVMFVDVEKMYPVAASSAPCTTSPSGVPGTPNLSLLDVAEGVAELPSNLSPHHSRSSLETSNLNLVHFVKVSKHLPLAVMKKMGYKMFAHESISLKNSITYVTDPFGSQFFLEETRPSRSKQRETETRRLEIFAGSLENRVAWEDWLQMYGARKVLSEEERAAQERILGEDGDQLSDEFMEEDDEYPLDIAGGETPSSFREGSSASLTNSSFLSVPSSRNTSNPRMRSTSIARKRFLLNPFAWGSSRQPTLPNRRGKVTVAQTAASLSPPQLSIGSSTAQPSASFDDIAQSETLVLESPRSGEAFSTKESQVTSPVGHIGHFDSVPVLTVTSVSPVHDVNEGEGELSFREGTAEEEESSQLDNQFSELFSTAERDDATEISGNRELSQSRGLLFNELFVEHVNASQEEPYSPPNPHLDTKEQSYTSFATLATKEKRSLKLSHDENRDGTTREGSVDASLPTSTREGDNPLWIPENDKSPSMDDNRNDYSRTPRAVSCDATTETIEQPHVTEVPDQKHPEGTPSNASLRFPAASSSSFAFPSNSDETIGGADSVRTAAVLQHPPWEHEGNLFDSAFSLSIVLRNNASISSLKKPQQQQGKKLTSQASELSFSRYPQNGDDDDLESFRDSFVTSPVMIQRRSPLESPSAVAPKATANLSLKRSPLGAQRETSQSGFLCPICGADKSVVDRCSTGRRHATVIVVSNRPASQRTEKLSRAAAAILLELEADTL